MTGFDGKLVVLDIEGTIAPLAYVHEVMFPYARERIGSWLAAHWGHEAISLLARDAGVEMFANAPEAIAAANRLMDSDAKVSGLKRIQGLVWEEGFRNGDLLGRLFDEVAPALERWRGLGIEIRIYSSGSIHAQRLFFKHSSSGDLTWLISGYYDTSTGSKKDPASYSAIASDCRSAPGGILFVSDLPDELDAARSAGMRTTLAVRPGNVPRPPGDHATVATLDDITFA